MKRLRVVMPWLGASGLLLSGCSSFRVEMGRPLSAKAGEFAPQASVAAVLQHAGPPDRVSALPGGFAFLYEFSRVKEFQLGISVDVSFLRYFKFVRAWNRLDQEVLLLTFDAQGLLLGAGSTQWTDKLGDGSAVQFVVQVMSLSDVSKVLASADAQVWGKSLLQPLPAALNSANSLRTGEHGLQQRIAPEYAGQQTLEMAKPKTEKEKKEAKKAKNIR